MIWTRRSPTESELFDLLRMSMTMFKAKQVPEEFLSFLLSIRRRRLQTILEIGTAAGGTLLAWSAMGVYDAKLIAVDTTITEYASYVFSVFLRDFQTLHAIQGDSREEAIYTEVVDTLDGGMVDLLYIDGGHYYDDVSSDFYNYKDLVVPGGIIVLHDIGITRGPSMQVQRFWNEIKGNYRYDEFISPDPDDRCGIGVLHVEVDNDS